MADDAAELLRRALALPESDRASIAAKLLASLDDPDHDPSPAKAEAWAREIERRIEQVVSGESLGLDLDTVKAQVRAALAASRA